MTKVINKLTQLQTEPYYWGLSLSLYLQKLGTVKLCSNKSLLSAIAKICYSQYIELKVKSVEWDFRYSWVR